MFRHRHKTETMRKVAERTEKERLERLRKKEKNRKCSNMIAFRMSDLEKQIFVDRQEMSGLIRQEFIIQSLTVGKVEFLGSTQAVNKILSKLAEIEMYIKNSIRKGQVDEVLLEELRQIIELMNNKKDSTYGNR